jgi:hypothetical protein
MLTTRDRAIIDNLNKFYVMDRDSIAELHFKGLKNRNMQPIIYCLDCTVKGNSNVLHPLCLTYILVLK